MDRRTIGLVWIGGIVLTAAVYAIGPQHFIELCEALLERLAGFLDDVLDTLMLRAFDGVRAVAIGLYAVFVVLAVLALRRGLRVGGTLLIVTVLFLLLVRTHWYDPATKWLAAAILTGVAAAVMTKRLIRSVPFRGDAASPWGKAFGSSTDRSQRVP